MGSVEFDGDVVRALVEAVMDFPEAFLDLVVPLEIAEGFLLDDEDAFNPPTDATSATWGQSGGMLGRKSSSASRSIAILPAAITITSSLVLIPQ